VTPPGPEAPHVRREAAARAHNPGRRCRNAATESGRARRTNLELFGALRLPINMAPCRWAPPIRCPRVLLLGPRQETRPGYLKR
jgi:hypothetical protein